MFKMDENKARAIISIPKFCSDLLDFVPRSNHKGSYIATASLEDEDGATIPGLTINIEYRVAIVVDRCNYEIGLFQLEQGHRKRVYQLHVSPIDKRSHREKNRDLYGPHEHIGKLVNEVRSPQVQCGNLQAAFEYFCAQIKLNFTGQLRIES